MRGRELLLAALPTLLTVALLAVAFLPTTRMLTDAGRTWTGYAYQSLLNHLQTYARLRVTPDADLQAVEDARLIVLSSTGNRHEFAELAQVEAMGEDTLADVHALVQEGTPEALEEAILAATRLNAQAHHRLNELRDQYLQQLLLLRRTLLAAALVSGVLSSLLIVRALALWRRESQQRATREAQHREALSLAAHELRRPLQGLLLAAELLRVAENAGDRRRLLDTIEDQALLLASRSDLEQLEALYLHVTPQPRPVDLGTLVGLFDRAPVRVTRPATPIVWKADPGHVRQILENLLENAQRYAPGPVELILEGPGDSRGPRLTVRDHGPGLPPQELERVFEPGYRASDLPGGRGLGLQVVRRLARANGGEVTLQVAPGGGLEAVLTLGVEELVACAGPQGQDRRERGQGTPQPSGD